MIEKLGRREQKKLHNRKAILDAGLDIFCSVGYERATIADIVGASGLSVGTFYNYFGDKDAIFAELIIALLKEVRTTLSEARQSAHSAEAFMMGAFKAYSKMISQQPKMQQLIARNSDAFRRFVSTEMELKGIVDDLAEDMQKAIDAGLFPQFRVKLMTSAIIASSVEIFSEDSDGDTED